MDHNVNINHQKRGRTVGCLLTLLLIAAIIGATMYYTCPQRDDHKEKLSQLVVNAVNQVVEQQLGHDNILLAKGMQMISNSFLGGVVTTALDPILTVDSYGVCSIGKINYDGKDNIVSLGLFGHVFTVNQDKVNAVAERYVNQFKEQAGSEIGSLLQQQVVEPVKESLKGVVGEILGELSGVLDDADDAPNADPMHESHHP